MRIATVLAVAMLGTTCLADPHHAQAAIKHYQLNIPRQPLDAALKDLAQQTGLQIGRFSGRVDGSAIVGPVQGDRTPQEALEALLKTTGLDYKIVSETTIAIYNPKTTASEVPESGGATSQKGEQEKSAQDSFRLAQVPAGMASGATSVTGAATATSQQSSEADVLQEVIVTAQKRNERLQDVPVPVAVLTADSLISENLLRLQDYYTQIPGFSVAPMGFQSTQILSIRGINTGLAGNPSVGVTVDDVPIGSSTNAGGGVTVPDFDPGDLARVEVLRGPQGTLYGASSVGGLLKFATVDPSTSALSGRVEAGTSDVYNGNEPGYNFRGSVNVPLGDTIAVRASAFTRRDPGYVDNPVQHIDGINEQHVSGGRLSALWRPSESLSLKASALYQDTSGWSNDVTQAVNGYVGPALGDLQQNYLPGVGGYNRRVQVYSLTLDAKLGTVDLTAVSGYNINAYHDSWDFSLLGGSLVEPLYGVTGAPFTDNNQTRKVSQEVRLASAAGNPFEWLLGAFYTHESSQYASSVLAADAVTGKIVGAALSFAYPTTYSEYAGFVDLTYHFTKHFDIQLGGRAGQTRQTLSETFSGPLASPRIPETPAKSTPFTYLLTPRYKISADAMLYMRLASGYRAGGINAMGVPDPQVAPQYSPDKTYNYELGLKGAMLDHAVSFDASVYYIDWKNVQLTLIAPSTPYIGNAGRAKSQGVELSVEARPLDGLAVAAWVNWNDAELKQGFPSNSSTYGVPGDRLPYTSRFAANLSVDEEFHLTRSWRGFVGGTISYVGERIGEFTSAPPAPPPRQDYPAYAQTNLRTGVRSDSWTINVFATNVFDRRGLLAGGLGSLPPYGFAYIQPRTAGLSIVKTF